MDHVISASMELRDRFTAKIKTASSAVTDFTRKSKKAGVNLSATDRYLNSTGRKFKKLGIKATRAGRTVKTATAGMKRSVDGLKSTMGSLGGLMTIGATGYFLKGALDSYADLEDQVRRNKAIMGASATEEAMLMEQTKKLGRETRFTANQVAEAQMYQAMAGMKTNEVMALTPKLLKLSIASGADLARTSDIITDNLDAFSLKLGDSARLMDVMAAAANNSNTSISMLGEAYSYAASASVGYDSMEEVTTILGIMANNGVKAGRAGRNLAAMYKNLTKITPEMKKQLDKIGLKLYDQHGKFKGLRNIIYESKEALSKMTDEQRNLWLATVAGTDGLKVWKSIMNYSSEATKKYENAIKNSSGATEKFAKEMSGDAKDIKLNFMSAFDGVKTAIGEGLAPAATDFMKRWSVHLNALNDSKAFSTENLTKFFNTAERRIKQLGILWAGYKFSALAAANPVLATLVATAGALGYLLKDSKDEHEASLIEINSGGKIDRETAKKMVALKKQKAFLSPEEIKIKEKEIEDSQKMHLEKKERKRKSFSRSVKGRKFKAEYRLSAIQKLEKIREQEKIRMARYNKPLFNEEMNKVHNSSTNNADNSVNNRNSTINNTDNSAKKNEVSVNLGGVTINNQADEQGFIERLVNAINTKMMITQ